MRFVLERDSIPSLPRHSVVRLAVGFHLLFVAATAIEIAGFELPIVQPVITFLYLFVLPGTLLLSLLGEPVRSLRSAIYAIALSQAIILVTLLGVNAAYLGTGLIPAPFTRTRLFLTITLVVSGLIAAVFFFDRRPHLQRFAGETSKEAVAFSGMVIVLAVIGAVFINKYESNAVALFAISVVATTPLVVFHRRLQISRPLVLWAAALALLLGNTVINTNLTHGDGAWEYYHARLVMVHWVWFVDFQTTYNTSLPIVLLHPLYALLADIDLTWQFKAVYPLFFSLLAPILYVTYQRVVTRRDATLAVFLYVFSFPFFSNLSRYTRTGFALFFVSVFFLAVVDKDLSRRVRAMLLVVMLFAVVVSHHAIALLFLSLLLVANVCLFLFEWPTSDARSSLLTHKQLLSLTVLHLVLFLLWYQYAASGYALELIEEVLYEDIIYGMTGLLSPASNATHSVSVPTPSITYQIIKIQTVLLIVASAVGVFFSSIAVLQRWKRVLHHDFFERFETDTTVLSLAVGAGFALAGAFFPTHILGIDRMYMFSMIFLMPYGVRAVTAVATTGASLLEGLSEVTRRVIPRFGHVASVILISFLLINTGFVAVALEERSPQPNLDRERILSEDDPREAYHLYSRYRPQEDVAASAWVINHGENGCTVYGSPVVPAFYSYFDYTDYDGSPPPGVTYTGLPNGQVPEAGYLYLDSYALRYDTLFLSSEFDTYYLREKAQLSELNVDKSKTVYDNGLSRIGLSGRCETERGTQEPNG